MRIRRGQLQDLYVDAGRSAVMLQEQVLVLSEVATAILEEVPEAGSVELEDVAVAVEAELGAPPPPATALALVSDQVQELVAHGVLVLDDPVAPAATSPRAVQALREALRHVLRDRPERWRMPDDVVPAELVAAAEQHHVVSFLHLHRDRLDLPAGAAASLHAVAAQRSAAVELLADDLHVALDALTRAGVRALVVKGLALAAQAHGHAAARGAGDLDLFVPPPDVERAHAALTQEGWAHDRSYPPPGPSWAWKHFHRTGYELSLYGPRSMIDLHWHLAPAHHSFPAFDVLWDRRDVVQVGTHAVPTLSPYDALAHSAGHASKDGWRWLRSLVDVHSLTSVPATWQAADRPLRKDQLLSVALAGRMFGSPAWAPPALERAIRTITPELWATVIGAQAETTPSQEPFGRPGMALVRSLRTAHRTSADISDTARQLGFSLLPPWSLAEETSPHAYVAAPRAMRRRGADMLMRMRAT